MYATRLIPGNIGLLARLVKETSFATFAHLVKRNLVTNMFSVNNLDGLITPNAVYFEPTYKCNRRCAGCYVAEYNPAVLEEQTVNSVCQSAHRMGVNYIAWLGGEPLLPETADLVLETTKRFPQMTFVVCTNADYINTRVADRIAKLPNLIPFISVDGFKETHDKRRGTGSYNNTRDAMALLKERKVMLAYQATIMPENMGDLTNPKFVQEQIESGCLIGNHSLFINSDPHNSEVRGLTATEYSSVIRNLMFLARSMPIYIMSTDFGYLGSSEILKAKGLMAMSVGPGGVIRTERGNVIVGQIDEYTTLEDIVAQPEVQGAFACKLFNDINSPFSRDARTRIIRNVKI